MKLFSVFALCMMWLQRFTEILEAAMNKGCHCFSTALTKSIESKAGAPYGVRPARPGSYLDFEE